MLSATWVLGGKRQPALANCPQPSLAWCNACGAVRFVGEDTGEARRRGWAQTASHEAIHEKTAPNPATRGANSRSEKRHEQIAPLSAPRRPLGLFATKSHLERPRASRPEGLRAPAKCDHFTAVRAAATIELMLGHIGSDR